MSKLKRFINRHEDTIFIIAIFAISIAIVVGGTLTFFKCVFKPLSEEKVEYFKSVATKIYSENVSTVFDLPDDAEVKITNSSIKVYSSNPFDFGLVIGTVENGELSLRYNRDMFSHVGVSICFGFLIYMLCLILFIGISELIEKIKRRRRYINPNKKCKKKAKKNPQ